MAEVLMKARRKHTAYLTEELVRALDHSYYERRLTEPISKQDFFEELLWRGLRLRGGSRDGSPSSFAPATTARQATPPPAPPTAAPPAPAEPPRQTHASSPERRRMTALDRLRAQAEPGRPSPIRSAADPG
jgi:hypothetical protein